MLKPDLKMRIYQQSLHWENPQANSGMWDELLSAAYGQVDMVLLPEMFLTGFTMNPEAAAAGTEVYDWLGQHAERGGYAVYGSVRFRESENPDRSSAQYYNRGVFMRPDRTFDLYDKRHTFSLAGEHEVYDKGTERVTANYKGWKFFLQICYDLRFPVFSRNDVDYDVLLYVANWPTPRVYAWDTLLPARAIENMSYTVGVNRVGKDGNGMDYPGHSQVYDALGHALTLNPWIEAGHRDYLLKYQPMLEARQKLKFLNDRDSFILN